MKGHGFWAGIIGAGVSLCCAGNLLLLSGLSGFGLGFLINDFILFPLLIISFGLVFYSLFSKKKKHGRKTPLFLALISMAFIILGIFLQPIIWIGIVGILTASISDILLYKRWRKYGTGNIKR